jgi:hypothetical protein
MTNGRSFFVRFARCFDYEKQLNDLSFLGSFYLPTKIVLYHNQTHKPQNPTAPPPPHHGAGSFCKSLDLRRGYVSYECTDAYHTRWAMPPPLGLEEFRRGHEQLLHFQPSCKLRFFLCMVIINSPGLWCGYDPSECTGAFATPWKALNLLGLVEFRRGDE